MMPSGRAITLASKSGMQSSPDTVAADSEIIKGEERGSARREDNEGAAKFIANVRCTFG